ncbi:hypothetical protein Celaphus_00002207, partial [Cervus elaphus hippelaphus]
SPEGRRCSSAGFLRLLPVGANTTPSLCHIAAHTCCIPLCEARASASQARLSLQLSGSPGGSPAGTQADAAVFPGAVSTIPSSRPPGS